MAFRRPIRVYKPSSTERGRLGDTQTIAPTNVVATVVNTTTINLTWAAITILINTGGYRILVGTRREVPIRSSGKPPTKPPPP